MVTSHFVLPITLIILLGVFFYFLGVLYVIFIDNYYANSSDIMPESGRVMECLLPLMTPC